MTFYYKEKVLWNRSNVTCGSVCHAKAFLVFMKYYNFIQCTKSITKAQDYKRPAIKELPCVPTVNTRNKVEFC